MCVQVYEPRTNDQARCVQDLRGAALPKASDLGYLPILDAEVAYEGGRPGAIDDLSALDDDVVLRHLPFPFLRLYASSAGADS